MHKHRQIRVCRLRWLIDSLIRMFPGFQEVLQVIVFVLNSSGESVGVFFVDVHMVYTGFLLFCASSFAE